MMDIRVVCNGLYVFNEDQGLTRACPLRVQCHRWYQRDQKKGVEERIQGPYDDATGSCSQQMTIGKAPPPLR